MSGSVTPEQVIALGGWDPRFARVLVVAVDGGVGLALVDTNDDGHVELQHLAEDDGTWRDAGSSGFVGPDPVGLLGSGETAAAVYACGRERAPGPVMATVAGREVRADATDEGWWAWCARR